MKSNPPSRGVGIRNISDYSPFGVLLKEWTAESADFRYGFQGMEGDSEVKGEGNSYDFGARIQDPRIGRWLSLDPLAAKYAAISPYAFCANNPIIYLDPDGRDIVYFDAQGNEVSREKSTTVFKTHVEVARESAVTTNGYIGPPTIYYQEAPMPTRITTYSDYEKSQGRDYNKYDYDIAAQTFLFNQKRAAGTLPDEGTGGDPAGVPNLDPNVVKSVIMKETLYGTITSKNGGVDIMQSNVSGDWAAKKGELGLTQGTTDNYQQSINAGIMWLYWKGVGDPNGVNGKPTWIGGQNWDNAVKNYNGGGDANYMSKYGAIKGALMFGSSVDGAKQAVQEFKQSVNNAIKSFFGTTDKKTEKKQ